MSGGYTISPVYDEATGQVTDFDVDNGYQGYRSEASDYIELDDGTTHHVFDNVSIREDGEFDSDDYYSTLAESDPRIPSALEWSATNLPPELIQQYNEAIDNDDFDTINRTIEYILAQYSEANPDTDIEDTNSEEDEVELTEEDQQVVEAISESLSQQPPLGVDVADEWDSVSQQAEASGDSVYAAVAQATAAYHAGSISASDAISWVLDNYPLKEVARVYNHLQQR
jgi:hypothetical protein